MIWEIGDENKKMTQMERHRFATNFQRKIILLRTVVVSLVLLENFKII